MIASAVSLIVVTSLICVALALYLIPCLIGCARRAPDIGAIAAINILLGWSLVGWAIALAMAFRSVAPGPPQAPTAGAGWAQHYYGLPASRPGSPPPLVIPPRHPADQGDVGHPDRFAPWV